MPNLTRRDLHTFLPQYDLTDEQVDLIILLVRSWLLEDTELAELPDPLPEVLWGGALELAALLADNPTSLSQKTTGPTSRSWPMAPQRDSIRGRIRRRYRAKRMAPQGGYPPARPWPEPADGDLVAAVASGWTRSTDGGWVYVG